MKYTVPVEGSRQPIILIKQLMQSYICEVGP
jgi:hypothetical protein